MVDEDGSPSLAALTGLDNPVKVDVDELVEKWIKDCLDKGLTPNRNDFKLNKAVSLIMSPYYPVEIVNKTQSEDSTVTVITEQELRYQCLV